MKRFVTCLVGFLLAEVCGADGRPIGVFDSGIGGMTVLERLLEHPGLRGERFTYLGDQANMPYGNYDAEGKRGYLRELVIKDALFLVSNGFFSDGLADAPNGAKVPAKIVVIACNTATAYGRDAADSVFKCIGGGESARHEWYGSTGRVGRML